ncbi:MAG: hypothetical protein JXR41_01850 [Bacteroidales bacterium]|nr:hypothetical protein [Bacteroidales bacterium]MBN2761804.1 hypothetical protein [Bacteroidales bacterium]
MNYRHTFEAAMADLNDMMNLLNDLRGKNTVSSIDIDLFLQKTRNLYEVFLLFRQDSNKRSGTDQSFKAEEPGEVTSRVQRAETEWQDDAVEKTADIKKEVPVENETVKKSQAEKKEERKILSDSIEGKPVLGESFQQQVPYQNLSSRLHEQPVTDLAKAIGINERFLYIRELFDNDAKKYEQAIQIINNAPNFNEAYNYMIREYTWDMDSEMVQELLEIIRRKYITGQHE